MVAYFVVGFLTSTVSGILADENDRLDQLLTDITEDTTSESPDEPKAVPEVSGDSFTVLFGVTDRREDVFSYFPENEEEIEAIKTDDDGSVGLLAKDYHTVKVKSVIIMRVCKETGEYTFIPIPSTSKVYTQMGGGYTLLEDVMYFYDKEYFTQKVTAMTGIVPDYTVFVNVTDMASVLNAVGGFTCYVEEDIYTDGKNYFPKPEETTTAETEQAETGEDNKNNAETSKEDKVVIEKAVSAGNVSVGSSNIEALLLYENYEDGTAGRCSLLSEILKGFIGRLSQMDNAALSQVYGSLIGNSKIDTDMTESELLAKGELLRAYDEFETTVEEYPGAMNGDYFVPDIMDAVKQYLGLRLPRDPAKGS